MITLTVRQQEYLDFIRSHRSTRGYGPTLREIGKHLGIASTHAVSEQLEFMKKKGAITWEGKTFRSLRAIEDGGPTGSNTRAIEVFSDVRAGDGKLVFSDVVRSVRVASGPIAAAEFGLVVSDPALLPNYRRGDMLFFRRNRRAPLGALVLARPVATEDTLVVRRLTVRGGVTLLLGFDTTVSPIIGRRDSVMAVAVGMLRSYESTPVDSSVDTSEASTM